MPDKLIVWDSPEPSADNGPGVYCWNGYAETGNTHSLFRYVDRHGERLRAKYLAWISDLGEGRVDGKRLIDHLAFKDGLSYWWMTLFAEKSIYKSPLSAAIRLLALEEIIIEQKPDKVLLVSADSILHETISKLCENLGIKYQWNRLRKDWRRFSIRNIYNRLPHTVRALINVVRYVGACWPLKRVERDRWFSGDEAIFICSYFIHLDKESCSKGNFYSRQWEILPAFLHASGFRTNWIQHYLKSSVVPSPGVAMDWVKRFNQYPREQGFHAFLDTFLSWRIVMLVLKRWMHLLVTTLRLRGGELEVLFQPQNSHITLWPLMRHDWYTSMCGTEAIHSLFKIELFDAAMQRIPRQTIGLYLCENQPWERAFIHAWRKHGHGRLYAIVHSTVRFWDLRHFADLRSLQSTGQHLMPQPDLIALNGEAAKDIYREAGIPMDNIIECEALRYLHLSAVQTEKRHRRDVCKNVLVLGGIMAKPTKKLLKLLEAGSHFLADTFMFTVKPHPNCMIKAEDYPSLHLEIVMDPLGDIMKDFDIAFTVNSTSSSVDAYLAGLSVVVMLDENELNLSPLRALKDIVYVTNPTELAEALQNARQRKRMEVESYFWLDAKLPRWRQLLRLSPADTE